MATGAALVRDLQSSSPPEVAQWLLHQLTALSAADAQLNTLPVAQLAGALHSASQTDLQGLTRAVVAGVVAFTPEERVDCLRLALSGCCADGDPPLLVKNAAKVAGQAHLEDVPEATWCTLAETAAEEAKRSVRAQDVVEVLRQLGTGERSQLTELLVEAQVVPEDWRGFVGDAIKPGGLVERLKPAVEVATTAWRWAPALLLLPFIEFALAYSHVMRGSRMLAQWMRLDSWITLGVKLAGMLALRKLQPLLSSFWEDPLGVCRRCADTLDNDGMEVLLRNSGVQVPQAIGSLALLAGLAFCSLLWAACGTGLALLGLILGCGLGPFVITASVICLRLCYVVPLVLGHATLRRHLLAPRGRQAAD